MKKPHLSLWISLALLFNACAPHGETPTQLASNFVNRQKVTRTTQETYTPKKNLQHITLYTKERLPHTAYRVIGVATISKYNLLGKKRNEADLHLLMKNLAASMGGDGLIDISHTDEAIHANIIAFQRILI